MLLCCVMLLCMGILSCVLMGLYIHTTHIYMYLIYRISLRPCIRLRIMGGNEMNLVLEKLRRKWGAGAISVGEISVGSLLHRKRTRYMRLETFVFYS